MKGPSAFYIANNGPVPTLKSLNLILTQTSLSPRDRAAMAYKYQTESLDFRFQRPGYQIVRMTMGPSQRYAMALTAVLGLVTELAISVVAPSGGTGGLILRKIASYELLDGAGSSVIGGSPIKSDYALMVKGARKNQSHSLTTNSLPWTRGEERVIYIEMGDSKAIWETGAVTGYLPADGTLTLALTTGADFQAGDHEVRIEFLACARLNVNRGVVSVMPS